VPEGGLGGSGMGRNDTLPISVPSGAYVVPADLVSGIGQGNTAAGHSILNKAFGSGPLGMPTMKGKSGFGGPKNLGRIGAMKMPKGSAIGSSVTNIKSPFQTGGGTMPPGQPVMLPWQAPPSMQAMSGAATLPTMQNAVQGINRLQAGGAAHTPIVAASGEHIIHPSVVLRIGKGNLKRGHDVLDKLMILLRKKHIKELQKLPPPVKRASGGRVPFLPDISTLLARLAA